MSPVGLVVDDDPVSRLVLAHMLRGRGWTVDEVEDLPAAVEMLSRTSYDIVVSDFHLPGGTGLDVLAVAEATDAHPAFVLVTGLIEHCSLPAETAGRVSAQLTKPVSSPALDGVLHRLGRRSDG